MKKFLLIALMLLICFSLFGCAQIEDANGEENFTVETITDEKLCSSSTSSSAIGSVTVTKNGKTSFSVKKLSGVYDFADFRGTGNAVTLEFSSEIEKGNLRMVIVHDGKIYADLPINCKDSFKIENAEGRYEIKFAAESAAFRTEMEIRIDGN